MAGSSLKKVPGASRKRTVPYTTAEGRKTCVNLLVCPDAKSFPDAKSGNDFILSMSTEHTKHSTSEMLMLTWHQLVLLPLTSEVLDEKKSAK